MIEERVRDLAATPNEAPIFVIGNQKSGTTVIGNLIAERSAFKFSNDMIFHRRWADAEAIARGEVSVSELIRRAPHEFSAGVIKDPDFTFIAQDLAERFPRAQFVCVIRNPYSNIKSILDRLGMRGDTQEPLSKARWMERTPNWMSVFGEGKADTSYVELLAKRWRHTAEICERTVLSCERACLVRYEDFTRDKVGSLDSVGEILGLPKACSIDGLVDFQFQSKGKHDVTIEECLGPNLEVISKVCGDVPKRFGYS